MRILQLAVPPTPISLTTPNALLPTGELRSAVPQLRHERAGAGWGRVHGQGAEDQPNAAAAGHQLQQDTGERRWLHRRRSPDQRRPAGVEGERGSRSRSVGGVLGSLSCAMQRRGFGPFSESPVEGFFSPPPPPLGVSVGFDSIP